MTDPTAPATTAPATPAPSKLNITPGMVIALVTKIGDALKAHSLIDAQGNFVKAPALLEASEIAGVATDVEAMLKADGLTVPANIDKTIREIETGLEAIGQFAS